MTGQLRSSQGYNYTGKDEEQLERFFAPVGADDLDMPGEDVLMEATGVSAGATAKDSSNPN